ncbi:hypothetical protein ACHAWF_009666 [Thalassiosira exigua]
MGRPSAPSAASSTADVVSHLKANLARQQARVNEMEKNLAELKEMEQAAKEAWPNEKAGAPAGKAQLRYRESDSTQPESFGDDDESLPDDVIVYTADELDAMRKVRAKLMEEHGIEESRVGSVFLAVATIVCKLRVDETVTKICKLLELMETLGCPDGIDDDLWKPGAAHELDVYAPAGKNFNGCRTIWVRGKATSVEEERNHCHACIMHVLAAHADPATLRNGYSFFLDLSAQNGRKDLGNEKKLQSFYQALPGRPQSIVIAGAGLFLRTVVQASIKVASLFVKQKMLARISFVTVKEAKTLLPPGSVPEYVGGEGGGISNYREWIKERLEKLPVPDL